MRQPSSIVVPATAAVVLLFLVTILPAQAQKSGPVPVPVPVVRVWPGAPLAVECALPPERRAEWRRGGEPVPRDMTAEEGAGSGGGLTARLTAPRARPHHEGVYTCVEGGVPAANVTLEGGPADLLTTAAAGAGAAAGAEAGDVEDVFYETRAPIVLNCSSVGAAPATEQCAWYKNGTLVGELGELKAHLETRERGAVLATVGRSKEDDNGTYTCACGGYTRTFNVRANTHAKLPADTSVVEGQKLKIVCKLVGRPYLGVVWTFSNSSVEGGANDSGVDVESAFGSRVQLRTSPQGVPHAELVLEGATRADAGRYSCAPLAAPAPGAAPRPAHTLLRVKDMYAALWPFLGICAEVLVLCAVILFYEKRRSKPEADDSDADNHDQKKS